MNTISKPLQPTSKMLGLTADGEGTQEYTKP